MTWFRAAFSFGAGDILFGDDGDELVDIAVEVKAELFDIADRGVVSPALGNLREGHLRDARLPGNIVVGDFTVFLELFVGDQRFQVVFDHRFESSPLIG